MWEGLVDEPRGLATDPELDQCERRAVEGRAAIAREGQPAGPLGSPEHPSGQAAHDLEAIGVRVEQDELVDREDLGAPGDALDELRGIRAPAADDRDLEAHRLPPDSTPALDIDAAARQDAYNVISNRVFRQRTFPLTRYRLELGPIPLHHQVYLDLRGAIAAGELQPGDRLPPERELARRYGCSLITVRRALSELAREARIERTRGRGTFILRPRIDRNLGDTLSFTDEMQTRGLDAETRLVAARPEAAGEAVANALGIEVGAPTLYVERLRLGGGEPLLLEQVHLPAERFPGLLASDLESNSLYDLLTERYGTHIARARETLEPVLLHAREARLLGCPARTPALLIESIASSAEGSPVELGRTYVRGDRTRYYVERVVVRSNPQPPATTGPAASPLPELVTAGRAGHRGP
jgi:GntR family transcriptional regulator